MHTIIRSRIDSRCIQKGAHNLGITHASSSAQSCHLSSDAPGSGIARWSGEVSGFPIQGVIMRTNNQFRTLAFAVLALSAPTVQAGMTWQRVPASPTTNFLYSVGWANGQFVAVGGNIGTHGIVLTSPDGIDWTIRPTPPGNAVLLDLAWNGSQWIAVGQKAGPGAEPVALTSPNGVDWTVRLLADFDPTPMNAVAWKSGAAPNYYLGVGQPTGMSVDVPTYRSENNGITWTGGLIVGGVHPLYSLLWDGGQFVTVGGGGTIRTSVEGVSWNLRTSGTPNDLHAITVGGGTYVAVGAFGTIQTSTNGIDWTTRGSGVTMALRDVAWNNNIFVAVGHDNVVLSSPDGAAWHPHPAPPPSSAEQGALNDVVWGGNNRWVAVGNFGEILYSDDSTPVELQSFTVD